MQILLVDDDRDSRSGVADFLRELGHQVTECANGAEAYQVFSMGQFAMILSDIKMPRMSGLELLQRVSAHPLGREVAVVLFTGHGELQSAIAALRAGAYDYLLKPINVEELAVITERIAEYQALRQENRSLNEETQVAKQEIKKLRQTLAQSVGLEGTQWHAPAMLRVAEQARKYHTDRAIPVLIQGETGTGKEVVARLIHYGDLADSRPFVDINCAALTASLFESELFGYEAGAFTGSLGKGQRGKLDMAQGGTLFLDEVAEVPLELQGKLLRVLQEREFYRVGGLKKIPLDVRIVCATNVDLRQRVEQGLFREDLYYRFKIGELYLPPLRERVEDILPLAHTFLEKFSREKGKNFLHISPAAAKVLETHRWPGNVRELRNTIEWSVFMYNDPVLEPEHLNLITTPQTVARPRYRATNQAEQPLNPKSFILPQEPFSLDRFVQDILLKALDMHNGNKTDTARYLDISRRSLYSRLK